MTQAHTYWRRFPAVEKLYTEGRLPEFLSRCELTCQQLDALTREGADRDAERARAAMTAYGHTLQLLDRLAAETAAMEERTAASR